mgnify:CR=1 FL=1
MIGKYKKLHTSAIILAVIIARDKTEVWICVGANSAIFYQKYDMRLMPQGESLHQTQERLMPYFWDHIAPELMAGHDQIINHLLCPYSNMAWNNLM